MNLRPFKSVLVANRGEIALRVIEAAKSRGLTTVAVHSDADTEMPFVRAADRSVCVGPAPAAQSYLDGERILDAARRTGAEAIHPGYGFLSENAAFARAVIEAGLVWIGPPPDAIEAMGDKARAKALMLAADVPCLPGWQGEDQSSDNLKAEAERIGFPLLIKAVAGGGGRGMRVVRARGDFDEALTSARREAKSAFGDDAVLLEKFVERGRHVEIQVFADGHGNTIHLGERDCSAQRRRQKVIEEAPSPALDMKLRARMGVDAVRAAEAVGYVGAGTVEFLLDDEVGSYSFLEMNTRLQVEHPVTEEVTGQALIRMQLEAAMGAPLALKQEDVAWRGHAIEARLYAEDPDNDFAPQFGGVADFDLADLNDRERIDHGVEAGDVIGTDYDAMVAKFVAWAETREEAIERLRDSLKARPLLGVKTNRDFLLRLLDSEAFRKGDVTTGDLDQWAADKAGPFAPRAVADEAVILAALLMARAPAGVARSGSVTAFELNLEVDGEAWTVPVRQSGPEAVTMTLDGREVEAVYLGSDGSSVDWRLDGVARRDNAAKAGDGALWVGVDETLACIREASPFSDDAGADPSKIVAPVSGAVAAVNVKPGDAVKAGNVVAVMEAMKMEMRLTAEADGTVAAVNVEAGGQAPGGFVLIELDLESED